MEALEAGDECVITTNEKLLPSIEMYDAVVFSSESQINFPEKRSPDQLYVFTSRESPLYTKNNYQKDLMQYNLTMTYRRDSDVFWPSGFIADAAIDASAWEFRPPKWKHAVFEKYGATVKLTSIIADKSKFSAWLKSQCTDKSMRIDFMSILENYIEIDIYGECGRLDCPGTQDECLEMVERDYFFIFIAENSICKDFITEALFSAMRYYIVPVVYGGANYGDFLPPHSFIDANKFNRTTELADYLQRLASDPTEYGKFFWWKKFYPQVRTKRTIRGLCRAIQEFSTRPARTGKFANIQSWWQDDSQCAQVPIIQLI
uniref:Fucosyltransferase n=1 Tax=Lutzomyia longipalpis TaxID=7200 RepID=A0A1B0CEU6_LUTLO